MFFRIFRRSLFDNKIFELIKKKQLNKQQQN